MKKNIQKIEALFLFLVFVGLLYIAVAVTFPNFLINIIFMVLSIFTLSQSLGIIDEINGYNQNNNKNDKDNDDNPPIDDNDNVNDIEYDSPDNLYDDDSPTDININMISSNNPIDDSKEQLINDIINDYPENPE